jgi:hypothetical protein
MQHLWPTPVMKDNITDTTLLAEVVDRILITTQLEQLADNFQEYDILKNDKSDVIQKFKNSVVIPAFEKFIEIEEIPGYESCHIRSWVTGAKHGYVINPHNHSCSSLSGVFYLLFEEKQFGGELILQDPRFNANRSYQPNFKKWFEDLSIMPTTGDIIIFPSYLYHYTSIFTGRLRLALAVDFNPVFDKNSIHSKTQYL